MTETRTQKPAFTDRRISNPLQYHYGTIPSNSIITLLIALCQLLFINTSMYTLPINIPIVPLANGVRLTDFTISNVTGVTAIDTKFLNPSLIEFFDNMDILPRPDLFFNNKNHNSYIHVDRPQSPIYQDKDYVRINWIYGGLGSTMNWYGLKPTTSWIDVSLACIYRPDQVDLAHSEHLASTHIVQVGIPHNVTTGPESRYCLGIVPTKKKDNSRITMCEARDIFQDYI
jgi:hypothetical protein